MCRCCEIIKYWFCCCYGEEEEDIYGIEAYIDWSNYQFDNDDLYGGAEN